MDIYAENILDHYHHPRGKTPVQSPTLMNREENVSCGDELTVELELKNGVIAELGWSGTGCAISQAAMSMLSEELSGKTLDEIDALKPAHILKMLGVPIGPRRTKCALLCLHTLKNAAHKAKGEALQSWTETVAL